MATAATPEELEKRARLRRLIMAARTKVVADALWSATKHRSKGARRTRDGRTLVITDEPTIITTEAGDLVGVELHVRLYDAKTDRELQIDPVRQLHNPPTEVATPEGGPNVIDPVAALWSALWDSIDVAPNPGDWRP